MGRFSHYFKDVDDPRTGNAKRHDFHEIVMIAVLSSLCGGQTCVDMADFAANNEEFLRRFMALERGTPSHDTFSRLFRLLDPKPLAAAMAELVADWGKALGKDGKRQIAVDGKALRRSYLRAGETSPLHMVSALLTEAGIVLGQTAVEGKSNEIPAMAALLDLLDIEGALVTADAMHAQRKTAELIIGKGGDYALALKANQGSLHEDAKEWLEDPEAAKEMLSHQHVDGGHGRVETRTATVSHDVGWLQDDHRWPGLQAVGKIEAVREAAGRTTAETRYYIMSREDGSRGAPGGRPQPLGDREPAALDFGCPDAGGRPAEPGRARAGEPRGHPSAGREHRALGGRQAVVPEAAPEGGASAGLPLRTHRKSCRSLHRN